MFGITRKSPPPRSAARVETAALIALADERQEMAGFADAVGFADGLHGRGVDYDTFGRLFNAKFKNIHASGFEVAYITGHERGTKKVQYAMEHGAKRGPAEPMSVQEDLRQVRGMRL